MRPRTWKQAREELEERAGIMQSDGNMTKEEAERKAKLDTDRRLAQEKQEGLFQHGDPSQR